MGPYWDRRVGAEDDVIPFWGQVFNRVRRAGVEPRERRLDRFVLVDWGWLMEERVSRVLVSDLEVVPLEVVMFVVGESSLTHMDYEM